MVVQICFAAMKSPLDESMPCGLALFASSADLCVLRCRHGPTYIKREVHMRNTGGLTVNVAAETDNIATLRE